MSTSSPTGAEPPAPGIEQRDARPERRVAINSGLLLAAFGFQALVSIVIVGVVARYLGQAGLGQYAYVISFIELFVVFADMGMNRILVREVSRNRANARLIADGLSRNRRAARATLPSASNTSKVKSKLRSGFDMQRP